MAVVLAAVLAAVLTVGLRAAGRFVAAVFAPPVAVLRVAALRVRGATSAIAGSAAVVAAFARGDGDLAALAVLALAPRFAGAPPLRSTFSASSANASSSVSVSSLSRSGSVALTLPCLT
ncbi:MAG: hypothetical protein IPJ62_15065 [Betaproteobacteria bacterium]|nr:hypothetical protein [Betaproteobacteria bacterium]